MPKLTHANGATIEVREDQVPAYLGQGWARVRAPKDADKRVLEERRAAAEK
jgi:hypothetical protein